MSVTFRCSDQSFLSESAVEPSKLTYPLSVSLQITRGCNLACTYCSELPVPAFGEHPSMEELTIMSRNLKGVERVILTGGEPLLRSDLLDVVSLFRDYPARAIATNGTLVDRNLAHTLAKSVDYVDITIDGPRKIHDGIRGAYDRIVRGARLMSDEGIALSVVTVLLPQNVESIPYVCQVADLLSAKRMKIVPSIPKGRGANLIGTRFTSEELLRFFNKIRAEKEKNGWLVKIVLVDWARVGEGHALLIHPNGEVVASPVFSKEGCFELMGNILQEDIAAIWKRYPYKANHVAKYLEKTIYVC